MFFQSLSEITPRLDFTMRVMSADNGTLTVSITPAAVDKMRPMLLTATPAELDEKFIEAIRTPVELAAQLDTKEYEDELRQKVKEKRLQTEVKVEKDAKKLDDPETVKEKPAPAETPAKKSSGKPASGKKAAPAKKEEPKSSAPAETNPAESETKEANPATETPESEIIPPVLETSESDTQTGDEQDKSDAQEIEEAKAQNPAAYKEPELPAAKYEANDRVTVTSGDHRGKVGTVLSGLVSEGKMVVNLDFGGGNIGISVGDLVPYNEPEEGDASTESSELLFAEGGEERIICEIEKLTTHNELTRFTTAHQHLFDTHTNLQEAYNAKRSELNQKAIKDADAVGVVTTGDVKIGDSVYPMGTEAKITKGAGEGEHGKLAKRDTGTGEVALIISEGYYRWTMPDCLEVIQKPAPARPAPPRPTPPRPAPATA